MFRKTALFVITAALSLSSVSALTSVAADSEVSKPYVNARFEGIHNALENYRKNGVDIKDIRVSAIPSGSDSISCLYFHGDDKVSELVYYDNDGVKSELKIDNSSSALNSFSDDGKMLFKETSENGYRYVVYKYNNGKLDELSVLSVNGDDIDFNGKKLTQEECTAAIEQLEEECYATLDYYELFNYDYMLGFFMDNPIEGPWEDTAAYMVDVYSSYFLFGSGTKENATFELVDINGDDVPELYAYAPDSSHFILFCSGSLNNGVLYSAFVDKEIVGFTDDGEIIYIQTDDEGEKMYYSCISNGDHITFDHYLFTSNGGYYDINKEITEEEYERLRKELVDRATHKFGENKMSYSEIMEYLKKRKEGSTETTTTTTTTTAASATSNTSSEASSGNSDSPKTGDSGVALPLTVLAFAVGTAFVVKQKKD